MSVLFSLFFPRRAGTAKPGTWPYLSDEIPENMIIQRNLELQSPAGRPFLLDMYRPDQPGLSMPVVIFCHGFKGFKDWGHWDLLARKIAGAGCLFVKFNFSHNGIDGEPIDTFTHLDAFGANNYSIERQDLDTLINWLHTGPPEAGTPSPDTDRLAVIGHSRGGALALTAAAADDRIRALITWASVSRLDYAWLQPGHIETWQKKGVYTVVNGRTGQEMPLYYQMYEDFVRHEQQFNTRHLAPRLKIPTLILHGTADPAVPVSAAHELHEWIPNSTLSLIEGGDHVFGGQHPYADKQLPPESRQLAEETITFLQASGLLT